MGWRVIGFLCALTIANACVVDPCSDWPGPASLELGTGGSDPEDFTELLDGDDLNMIISPRGEWILAPKIRATGIYPGGTKTVPEDRDVAITIGVHRHDTVSIVSSATLGDDLIASGEESVVLGPASEGTFWISFLGDFSTAAAYAGETVTLRAEIADPCGNTATDQVDVVLRR